MQTIYEASSHNRREDFADIETAKAWVIPYGFGRVVTFIRGSDGRDRSCAMIAYSEGEWRGVDISR